jgi:hypothetical protein
MDMESFKPTEPLLKNHTCFLSREPPFQSALLYNLSSIAMNALMACKRRHQFFTFVISRLPAQQRPTRSKSEATNLTGPLMLQKAVENYTIAPMGNKDRVTLLPYWVYMPTMDSVIIKPLLKNNCKWKGHPLWKKACRNLKWYAQMDKIDILRGAYGDHKFLHLGHRQIMWDYAVADVYNIAPTVYRYQKKQIDGSIFIIFCACLFVILPLLMLFATRTRR